MVPPDRDRRRKSFFDIMIPALVAIVTVLIGVIGAGIINALHDLTTEVRSLSSELAVVETNVTNDRDRRVIDERAIGQLQVDVREIMNIVSFRPVKHKMTPTRENTVRENEK